MTKDEALKLALDALERSVAICLDPYSHEQVKSRPEHFINQTIIAIKEALETKDEPVAYINVEQRKLEWAKYMIWETPTVVNLPKIPLYTTPQRTWVGLTDEEIEASKPPLSNDAVVWELAVEWAEAKLKERNT